jgi:hypothetical protein
MSVRKGEAWGRPATGPADVTIEGSDADLAAAADRQPGVRAAFVPVAASDLARALGVAERPPGRRAHELPLDALRIEPAVGVAVNMAVLGTAPDRLRWWSPAPRLELVVDGRPRFEGRATTVVVANGQYLRGVDVVPRGHPGDGRVEVQVYALSAGERREMRRRLPQGAHLPHPRIRELSGRRIEIRSARRGLPLEVDGVDRGRYPSLHIEVAPCVLNLVV